MRVKKAKEEIKNRIELETLENLKAKRLFYVEQIEMTDLLNLENDIDSLHQIILDVYDKARMNDSFFGKGLVEKKKTRCDVFKRNSKAYQIDFSKSQTIQFL